MTQINAEMVAYGQWMERLNAIQQPVMDVLVALQPAWQAAMKQQGAGAGDSFRPLVDQAVDRIEAADAALAVLDQPVFTQLELDQDVTPQAMVDDTRELNRQIRTLMLNFLPLIDAMTRRDEQAGTSAARQMLDSMRLLLSAREKMARAALASTPRDEGAWHITHAELLYAETMSLIGTRLDLDAGDKPDLAFAEALTAMAVRIEQAMMEGESEADATLEQWNVTAAELENSDQPNGASAVQRAISVITVGREIFAIVARLAPILRAGAEHCRTRPVTITHTGAMMAQIRPIGIAINEVGIRVGRSLAGTQ